MSVEKFVELFTGRKDVYGFNEVCIKEPLTKEIYEAHLKGDKRIGIYPIVNQKFIKWTALDIDEDDLEKAILLQERFKHYNIPAHIERSKSKGYHIWIFLDKLIEAVKIRLVAEMIMEETDVKCEIFPKQDESNERNPYGNFIFLPLFGQDIVNGRTIFLHPSGEIKVKSSNELNKLKLAQTERVEEILRLNNLTREERKETESISRRGISTMLPCIAKMQEGKLEEGEGRNEVGFRLTIYFKEKGLGKDDVQVLLSNWNLKNIEPLDKKELHSTIESVFKGQYKSYGCEGAIIQKFCNRAECPIIQAQDRQAKIEKGIITLVFRDLETMVFKKLDYEYRLSNIQGLKSKYEAIIVSLTLSKDGKLLYKDIITLSKSTHRKRFIQAAKDPELDSDLIKIEELVKKQFLKELQEGKKPKQLYLMTETEKNEALKYLQEHPHILAEIIKATDRLGVIGEEGLRLMLYLCFTSRITNNPLSITVKGEASSGKSFICEIVRQLIPEEGYYFITKATQQAFFHLPEDGLQHRIVFISELPGSQAADYSIRTAQSEGDLILIMPIKNPQTGDIETQTKRVRGPVGFMMTTTQASLFDENETRNFSLYTDDSPELTKRTAEITIKKALGEKFMLQATEFNLFKNIQRLLSAEFKIFIPFAEEIFRVFPDKPVRIRRDRERFRVLIEVITLLHQFHRKQYKKDETNILEANLADYYLAKKIGEEVLLHTLFELGPASDQTWQAIMQFNREMIPEAGMSVFTYKDIQAILDWKYEKTKKWTLTLLRAGYIEYTEESYQFKGGRGKSAKFKVAERYRERLENQMDNSLEIAFLPKIEELIQKYPCDPDLFYHPYSGTKLGLYSTDSTEE